MNALAKTFAVAALAALTSMSAAAVAQTLPGKGKTVHYAQSDSLGANYVEVHNSAELAVVRRLDSQKDDVVAVPDTLLRKRGLIRDDELPFDVKVVHGVVGELRGGWVTHRALRLAEEQRFAAQLASRRLVGVEPHQRAELLRRWEVDDRVEIAHAVGDLPLRASGAERLH